MNFYENFPKPRKHKELIIRVIGSSSEGNCTLIQHNNDKILIDAGISRKRVIASLAEIGCSLDEISGIFITHAHSDHIKNLSTIIKNRNIPVFATKETYNNPKFPRSNIESFTPIKPNQINIFGTLRIVAVSSSHDINGSVVYFINNSAKQIGIITDLGLISAEIAKHISASDLIMLETNYDEKMLINGYYPDFLKARILSSQGHLSNKNAAEVLIKLKPKKLHTVLCSHISKDNNTPELASETLSYCTKKDRELNCIKVDLTFRHTSTQVFTA